MTLFGAPTSAVRDRKSKQLPPPQSWDQDAGNLGMPALLVLLRKTCKAAPFTDDLQILLLCRSSLPANMPPPIPLANVTLHLLKTSPHAVK